VRDYATIESVDVAVRADGWQTDADLAVGDTATLIATAGNRMWPHRTLRTSRTDPTGFDWTSSDPRVATVDRSGVVRAVAPGVTVVGASAGLRKRSSFPLRLRVRPAGPSGVGA
jgi:uncharacterized protein YjdB